MDSNYEISPQQWRLIKRKWVQINWRCNNQKSYIKKGITNNFPSLEDFAEHCMEQGLKEGLQSHRPDNNAPYSRENLTFITAEEHKAITRKERRKLNDQEVIEIQEALGRKEAQRSIAKRYQISQALVWRIKHGRAYGDVH